MDKLRIGVIGAGGRGTLANNWKDSSRAVVVAGADVREEALADFKTRFGEDAFTTLDYRELLAGANLVLPYEPEYAESVYHLFVVRVRERDRVLDALKERGIGAGVHYPVPLHLQPAYAHLGHRAGDFPHAEAAAQEVLSLPLYAEMTDEQVRAVCETLTEVLG